MPCFAAARRGPVVAALTLLALIAAFWVAIRPVNAQQQGQLYISVLDSAGNPVTDLEPPDVTVSVDDVDCRIVGLEPVSKPMKVTLMVDNGMAVSAALSNLRSAVRGFIEAIPDDVEMELLTIAPQPRWLEKFTKDRTKLLKAVDLLSPDSGAGLFFDALVEAGKRVEKDKKDKKEKNDYLPVFVMLASDVGRNSSAMDRDYQNLQKNVLQHGITVHFIVLNSGGERVGSVAGALQTEVGLAVTKLSGGRYEAIAAPTRLITLLPELAHQIAQSNVRQMHQYRITYERPGKDSKPGQRIAAGLRGLRIGVQPQLSIDGHMPVTSTQ
jgi:hypothetical protein